VDLAQLFHEHGRYIAAVALKVLGRRDEVEDVVQEVFLNAQRGMHSLTYLEGVRGWLATITVRVARRRLRRRRIKLVFGVDKDEDYLNAADRGASPEQAALLANVYRALEKVPADDRIAWTLRYVEGSKLDEVAKLCGCSIATVKRRVAAAQIALEEALGHHA
jgi:RNA polymerase sigma-70 factor (ECF subfamily)